MSRNREIIHILLVEHNETIVKEALKSWQAQVKLTVVQTLAAAHDFLRKALPHLVLVDSLLPDGKGIDLLPITQRGSGCPVVIMGSHGDETAAVTALKAGAIDYVVKSSAIRVNIASIVENTLQEWRQLAEHKQAQDTQRKSEAQFLSIFKSASAGIAILGVQGEILQANPMFCQLLGYSNKELLKLKLNDITHPEDRQRTQSLYADLLADRRKTIDYEKRYLKKDGSSFWGHPTVARVAGSDQTLLHFVAQIQDISERRRAEKELLTAHQQLQNIIEFLPDATFVIDREKRVTAWNRSMEEKTGIRKEDILGRGENAYSEALYGEHKPILIDLIGGSDTEKEAQYSFFEKKGKTLFAERFMPTLYGGKGGHVWLKASPLYDLEGNLVGAIESIRNITDRKLAEQELRLAHQQMQDIIEFLPDATFVIGKSKKVLAWNRAMEEMSGVNKEEMVGQEDYAYSVPFYGKRRPILIDLIGSPDLEKKAQYDFVGNRGETIFVEQYLPNLYGEKGAYVWATASQLLDQEGNPAGAIESIRDITDRKQTEEKLKEANRELDSFVYTVAHDLRSPLTPIIGYAQHLKVTYEEQLDEQALNCLMQIETQGDKMAALLEDLLSLAKVGHLERPTAPVDLDLVAQEVITGLGSLIASKEGVVLRKALPKLFVPKMLLFQVLNNLIGNAVRYADNDAGPIEVGGERSGARVSLYVRDHGPGATVEERNRIFDVFTRGAASKDIKGTGVGLAIVQKIARLYEGKAWVEDTPGGGSTFWVEMVDTPRQYPPSKA